MDSDKSSPNNEVVYRLGSKESDKFFINPKSGVIRVRKGANLDPDLSFPRKLRYQLEVFALDGGIGKSQLTGSALVEVSVLDVNNKSPKFRTQNRDAIGVLETAGVGTLVTKVNATDSDVGARIVYSLDERASEAFDENGDKVASVNLQRLFEVDGISGDIRVVGNLDRERFEMAKLVIMAEDLNSDSDMAQVSVTTVSVILLGKAERVYHKQGILHSTSPV